jgi:hypothetical protein
MSVSLRAVLKHNVDERCDWLCDSIKFVVEDDGDGQAVTAAERNAHRSVSFQVPRGPKPSAERLAPAPPPFLCSAIDRKDAPDLRSARVSAVNLGRDHHLQPISASPLLLSRPGL